MGKKFYHALCGIARPFYNIVFPARVEGLENLPEEGGCIVCANHLHARDPFYLAVRVRRRMLHYMAKAELFKWKPLAWIMRALEAFPVDRGHNDLNAVRTAMKLLAELDTGKGVGLIERKRQGQGKPTRIYVKRFTTRKIPPKAEKDAETAAPLPEVDFSDLQKSVFPTS